MSFSALRRYSARRQGSTAALFFVPRRGARFRSPQSEPARQRTENSPVQSSDGGYESGSTFSSEAHVRAGPAGLVLETKAVPSARLGSAAKSQIIHTASDKGSDPNAIAGLLS